MGARPWIIGVLAGAVLIGLGVAAYQMGVAEGEDRAQSTTAAPASSAPAKTTPKPASGPGKQLFASTCGSCHTLSAAGTSGTAGPNLDDLKPDQARVLAAIQNGGTGSGQMPPGLLRGEEAAQVADFVSGSAGP
jgi:mono/diheme cytochrome c family protein